MNENDVNELLNYGTQMRGEILSSVITLESSLNLVLAQHFCHGNEMTSALVEMVFATKRITFDHKREILKGILKIYYPPPVKFKDEKFLENKIEEIATHRNIFAHFPLATYESSILRFKQDKTLVFLKYNYSEIEEIFPPSKISTLIENINSCTQSLNTLLIYKT